MRIGWDYLILAKGWPGLTYLMRINGTPLYWLKIVLDSLILTEGRPVLTYLLRIGQDSLILAEDRLGLPYTG